MTVIFKFASEPERVFDIPILQEILSFIIARKKGSVCVCVRACVRGNVCTTSEKNVMPMLLSNLEGHAAIVLSAYGTWQRRIGYRVGRALGYIGVRQQHFPLSKWRCAETEV